MFIIIYALVFFHCYFYLIVNFFNIFIIIYSATDMKGKHRVLDGVEIMEGKNK